MPYVIVQPRLLNRFEYKVVLLDGKVISCFSVPRDGHAFCRSQEEKINTLFPFAEYALKKLKEVRLGAVIDKGLDRVDIMINDTGKFVVNEFESLEAKVVSHEIEVQECLKLYYLDNLKRLSEFI